jgi:hypothetical protein
MTDDPTKDLTDSEKLNLILSKLSNVESRLSNVETRLATLELIVEDRLKDTRPIWQAINVRTERIEGTLIQVRDQMAQLAYDNLEVARLSATLIHSQQRLFTRVGDLENRVSENERRLN